MAAPGNQGRRLVWGVIAAVATTTISWLIWGRGAIVGALSMGGVAVLMQLLAAQATGKGGTIASLDQMTTYVIGLMLRLAGVIVLGVMMTVQPDVFLPLPSSLGYLGTVLPLLYLETRLTRISG